MAALGIFLVTLIVLNIVEIQNKIVEELSNFPDNIVNEVKKKWYSINNHTLEFSTKKIVLFNLIYLNIYIHKEWSKKQGVIFCENKKNIHEFKTQKDFSPYESYFGFLRL